MKIDRLLSKEEKQYIKDNLFKFERLNKEKTIQQLNQGVMIKQEFAEFIRLLGYMAFNQKPVNESNYNSLETIDKKLANIHKKLEIKYNKFYGESPELKKEQEKN